MLSVIFNITELLHTMEVLMRSNRCKVKQYTGEGRKTAAQEFHFNYKETSGPGQGGSVG